MQSRLKAALSKARRTALLLALLSPLSVAAGDTEIAFWEDADWAADQWVRSNPNDIAIVVRLGSATTIRPEKISSLLRQDFKNNGGCSTRVLFERGGDSGSAVAFYSRNHTWGPFSLADSRSSVAEACAQHRFEIDRELN